MVIMFINGEKKLSVRRLPGHVNHAISFPHIKLKIAEVKETIRARLRNIIR